MEPKKLLLIIGLLLAGTTLAFCGFYVAKADTDLFNESSKVILARDGNRTILTMANDFQGDVQDFAMVVPVPYVLGEDQIQVGDPALLERIDAYSAPRLVEYFDPDPCMVYERDEALFDRGAELSVTTPSAVARQKSLGVTIEAQFTKGEYDILILSAEESEGLETWLSENGYQLPAGASEVLGRYLAQGMKFFVAKVNLEVFEESGYQFLRPLLMAFESENFMLPIQLGMINASGPQDLVVYLLSPRGRIELANYPIVKIPSDVNLPEYIENDFGAFYRAMFQQSYEREGRDAVFLEYAWDMAWCDPCAADPLSSDELARAGVFWLDANSDMNAPNVYLTRLHVRYTKDEFPEDLMFRVTDNRENFQGRYILQRPFEGDLSCEGANDYVRQVRERQEKEARTLSRLTGWNLSDITAQMGEYNPAVSIPTWWERVFNKFD